MYRLQRSERPYVLGVKSAIMVIILLSTFRREPLAYGWRYPPESQNLIRNKHGHGRDTFSHGVQLALLQNPRLFGKVGIGIEIAIQIEFVVFSIPISISMQPQHPVGRLWFGLFIEGTLFLFWRLPTGWIVISVVPAGSVIVPAFSGIFCGRGG